MKYKDKGYNRLLAGEVYNLETNNFENLLAEDSLQNKKTAKI